LVTALLFAVSTLDLRVIPSTLLFGLALGWLRARSGSLFGPVAAVLAFRGFDAVAILRGHDPLGDIAYPLGWVIAGAAVAAAALGLASLSRAR
jgi:hypothetical protein